MTYNLTDLYFILDKYLPNKISNRILFYITQKQGGDMYSKTLRMVYKKKYGIEIGYGSYGGCFKRENIPSGVKFGNYCSIAPNIRIFRANHPKINFTMHPLLYNPICGYVTEDKLNRPPLTIGHDVWIGEWAIILPSVKHIGNGAIIGAGSVVTKDVEEYSVVAGNPAKHISYRFNSKTINFLEESKWWNMKKVELINNISTYQQFINTKKFN